MICTPHRVIIQINGRQWRTTCEPYSQTTRCRTEIKATKVTEVNGRFVSRTGWVFNNLTYKESPRSLWKGNPLAKEGVWTSASGHNWLTECDTPVTGRNGCRSYIEARQIVAYQRGGQWNYRWTTRWVLNNIVRFTANRPTPPAPTRTPTPEPVPTPRPTMTPSVDDIDPSNIVDENLRSCVMAETGTQPGEMITREAAAAIKRLKCQDQGINTVAGMPALPNLKILNLTDNALASPGSLQGLASSSSIAELELAGNGIASLQELPVLPKPIVLGLQRNNIAALDEMPMLPTLEKLQLSKNRITSTRGLPELPNLTVLQIRDNKLTSLQGLTSLPNLEALLLEDNEIVSFEGLPALPMLTRVEISNNEISSFKGLPASAELKRIEISNNEIASLDGLPEPSTLPGLESLALNNNAITVVSPLSSWTQLRYLELRDNPITDAEALQPLRDAGCVTYL